jgi:quinoprotein glucose dehydrogenase
MLLFKYINVFGWWILKRSPFLLMITFFSFTIVGCNYENSKNSLPQHSKWQNYGGGSDQSKFVVVNDITKSNVDKLKIAWFYPTRDKISYAFNPIIVDSVMYVMARNNSLVALNAKNGKEIWIHTNLKGLTRRGINYWESADRKDRRLIFQKNDYLQEIDAVTGKSILDFGTNGVVDLREGLGRDPKTVAHIQNGTPGQIFDNLIILGSAPGEDYLSAPGDIRAYDVITGKMAWSFHTVPHPGEYGYDTWPKDAYKYVGGTNCWGEISVDEKRGIAYVPLGSPTSDFYGADRIGKNLFSDCIVALDAASGKLLWYFQTVHHDLFDYDLTAAPQLVTLNRHGKKVDVVAVATKQGFLFVFDRVTGKPIWPIEERPVPKSDVPGEKSWPTQPFPTVIPPYSRQIFTSEDLNSNNLTDDEIEAWNLYISPEQRKIQKERISKAGTGLYTPLSLSRETAAMPGTLGGTSAGNTAANPEKGIVYLLNRSHPSIFPKLKTREQLEKEELENEDGSKKIAVLSQLSKCQTCHGNDFKGLVGPSLLNLSDRFSFNTFKETVWRGKGVMPANPDINEIDMKKIYEFLKSQGAKAKAEKSKSSMDNLFSPGPVVADGGAIGEAKVRTVKGGGRFGDPYPKSISDTPSVRYFSKGYGLDQPYLAPPPWSEIISYDLNRGTIKWRVPLGQSDNGKNTGSPSKWPRYGMIVTSTGLVFCTAGDGTIYAYDADNGNVLWSAKLPMESDALPSMYEINGRHYLVVAATTPHSLQGLQKIKSKNEKIDNSSEDNRGYVVFSIPE